MYVFSHKNIIMRIKKRIRKFKRTGRRRYRKYRGKRLRKIIKRTVANMSETK